MTAGEKIKHFRNLHGISQETLRQLSDINSAAIKSMSMAILLTAGLLRKYIPTMSRLKLHSPKGVHYDQKEYP